MPIDAALAGRAFPPSPPVTLTQTDIDAFNAAVSFPGPEAAPTYAFRLVVSAWQPMFADSELGIELSRLVHADQRFALDRPFRAGDRVTAAAALTSVRAAGGTDRLVVDTAFEVNGEPFGTATSTLLHAHERRTDDPAGQPAPPGTGDNR